jgi:hypothetical protein
MVNGNDSEGVVAQFVVKQPENELAKKVDSVRTRGAMYKYTKTVRRGNKWGNAKFFHQ